MKQIFHWILIISGILTVLIGLMSLFIPVVPGLLLIFLGLVILNGQSKFAGFIIKKFPPLIRNYFESASSKINPILTAILIILSLMLLGFFLYYFLQFKN